LAKPNYSFEKRQRELAKKKKKEEKKAARKTGAGGDDELTPNEAAMGLAVTPPDAATPDTEDDKAPPAQP
jgi:hypothetical protein